MHVKQSLTSMRRSLSTGIGPSLRYFLSAVLIGLSLGLLALASYLILTPIIYEEDALKEASHWTTQNCSNRLESHNIPHSLTKLGIKVRLESSDQEIDRGDLAPADMALLVCPGMELANMCIGASCPEQTLLLKPTTDR